MPSLHIDKRSQSEGNGRREQGENESKLISKFLYLHPGTLKPSFIRICVVVDTINPEVVEFLEFLSPIIKLLIL
jgi:hypothetical protein